MGLFKKSDKNDGDDGSDRRGLFGSRNKNKSPAQNSNPYAKPIPPDPYTKAKINAGVAPMPDYQSGGNSPHSIPSDNKYSGYTPNAFGNQGGYGSDRFGNGSVNTGAGSSSRYGASGWGGLGSSDPNGPGAAEAQRNELLGNRGQSNTGAAPPPYSPDQGGQRSYPGGSNEYSTATYQERQLTAEEEEELEIEETKRQMKETKMGDVSSTRNALRVAAQAEETGRNALAQLGAQGERVHDTEHYLDKAAAGNRRAGEKGDELRVLNQSMFRPHISNPFTSAARRRDEDERLLNEHRSERETREGTRSEAFQNNARLQRDFRDIERDAARQPKPKKANVVDRSKYQFEADEEDDAMEDELDQNLDLLGHAASRLNGLAKATGRELDEQNRHLERIAGKSDFVDDQLAANRAKLNRIR